MSTPHDPFLSFSKRALDSKLTSDLFANYAIACQCESLGLPTTFVDSLKSFHQKKDGYIEPIKSYCCKRHYFSSYLASYLSSNRELLRQLSIAQNNNKSSDPEIVDFKKLAIESEYFDPNFYRLSNPDLHHCSNQELVDHFSIIL